MVTAANDGEEQLAELNDTIRVKAPLGDGKTCTVFAALQSTVATPLSSRRCGFVALTTMPEGGDPRLCARRGRGPFAGLG